MVLVSDGIVLDYTVTFCRLAVLCAARVCERLYIQIPVAVVHSDLMSEASDDRPIESFGLSAISWMVCHRRQMFNAYVSVEERKELFHGLWCVICQKERKDAK